MIEWQSAAAGFIAGAADLLFVSIAGHLELLVRFFDPRLRGADVDLTVQLGVAVSILVARPRSLVRTLRASSRAKLVRFFVLVLLASVPTWFFSVWGAATSTRLLHRPDSLALALTLGALSLAYFVMVPPGSRLFSVSMLGPREALLVGALHPVSLWPGTSHLLVAWLAGRLVGFSPRAALDLAWVLTLSVIGPSCAVNLAAHTKGMTSERVGMVGATMAGVVIGGWLAVHVARALLARRYVVLVAAYRLALACALVVTAR